MNIYTYAKKMEKDSEKLYRDLAAGCFEINVTGILTRLAEEEVTHYRVIEKMEKNTIQDFVESNVLEDDVKNIVEQLQENRRMFKDDRIESEVYMMALDLEKKSQEFYEQKARETGITEHKDLFLKLAREESNHYRVIEVLSGVLSR